MSSRKNMAAKNIFSSVSYYIFNAIFGFVDRKIFIIFLGSEILGLNGLLTSVISMLSLLELGVASSIGFSLYKPLQENDQEQIKGIMKLFSRIYKMIGCAVGIIGLLLTRAIPIIAGSALETEFIIKVYWLFLADVVLSYFLAYRKTLIQASQREYINKKADSIAYIIVAVLKILIICKWQNYILALVVKLIFTIINNGYLYRKAARLFPFLKDKMVRAVLPAETKSIITQNVKALFVIRIAYYLVAGTDNILLSVFTDLTIVAIYSGYTLIIGVVNNIFNNCFGYMTANVGNYLVSKGNDDQYDLYNKMFFINYLIVSYTSISMVTLFNEFIGGVWLGDGYVFPFAVVVILVFNNYSRFMTQCSETFRGAAGLYSPRPFVKYLALLEGLVNLVVSVLLAYCFGMGYYGIFLGTTVSTIVSTIAVPWIVHKFLFKCSMRAYWKKYFQYLLWAAVGGFLSVICFHGIKTNFAILNVVFGIVISAAVTFVLNYVVYGRSREGRYVMELFKTVVCKVIKRNK